MIQTEGPRGRELSVPIKLGLETTFLHSNGWYCCDTARCQSVATGRKSRLTRRSLCREDGPSAVSKLRGLGGAMRWACLVALTAMTLTDIAVASVVRHGSIPRAYIGSWAPSATSCAPRSGGVVVLSAKRYVGAERKCSVRGVYETAGPHGPIYSARMQCSGPAGASRKSVRNLIIVPAGTGQLSLGSDFDNLKSYQRCQSRRPTATQ